MKGGIVRQVSAWSLGRKFGLRRPLRLGSLRRTTPISDHWGADRGMPIDRYYIERFLSERSADIKGRVVEVKDRRYTETFGHAMSHSDVLDIDASNPLATIVADLSDAPSVPSNSFDCVIVTQTLQFIFAFEAAIRETYRLLRPGGVLLATVPSVSRIDRNAGVDADFWRFTTASCRRMFGAAFGDDAVDVRAYGNVLATIGFLAGLACEDLSEGELDVQDELFPLVVGVRAVKR
jgi:SAM-dependent methyltransferase